MRKIHVHCVIIVVNIMLVILKRVGLSIYGVTCNLNVGNLPVQWLIKNKRPLVFILKKEVGDGDVANMGNLKVVKYDHEAIRQALTSMIIRDELPFRVIEREIFKDYSHLLEPRFVIHSRIIVWRDCIKLFMKHKILLKFFLKNQCLCITTDTWSSIQNYNYMCLIAHWIDQDWKL